MCVLSLFIESDLVYLGCHNSHIDLQTTIINGTTANEIVQKCRETCISLQEPTFSLIKGDDTCACSGKDILDNVILSNNTCGEDAWLVFFASGITKEHPYFIDLAVQHLTSRDYIKPSESVLIQMTTNLHGFVEFIVDMGDGIKITTLERNIYHYWYQEGNYSISATTKMGSITVSGTTYINIQDVDEGIPPEVVHISGYHFSRNLIGTFDIVAASNYSTVCFVDFGDGSMPYKVTSSPEFVSQQNVGHTFVQLGLYHISATCKNAYGEMSYSTLFLAKSFDLLFEYFQIGHTFQISYASGIDYSDSLDIIQNDVKPMLYNVDDGNITLPLARPYENLLSFDVGAETIQKRIFYVQSEVETPQIIIEEVARAWNLTTNVTILVPPGFQIFINCSFGLSVDEMFYVYEANDTVVLEFMINYTSIGYYDVTVNTSNDISFTSQSELISVEVPIVSMEIETENIFDKTIPVSLNISLNMGEDGPQKVKFRVDHADGNVKYYNYFSSTKMFTPYINDYIYSDWGIYRICVAAINEISNVTACAKVQVGQNMTYNDLQTSTDARVTTYEYAEVIITSSAGSDRTYVIDFGDEFPFTITDKELELGEVTSKEYAGFDNNNDSSANSSVLTTTTLPTVTNTTTTILLLTTEADMDIRPNSSVDEIYHRSTAKRLTSETISVKHMYPRPGSYRVKVTIQNEFSFDTKHLCPSIIVDDADISNCDRPEVIINGIASPDNKSYEYERVRSEQIDIVINASSTCNDNFRYSWKMTMLLGGYYKTFDSICTTDVETNILQIPGVFLVFGKYRIVITVSPVNFPRATTVKQIDLLIIPSHPVAHIAGDDDMWFLTFGSTTIDFKASRDPDLKSNIRKGLSYDLFCMPDSSFIGIEFDNLETLKGKSTFIIDAILFGGKTKNPARFYDHANCLDIANKPNATTDISLSGGLLNMPSRLFSSESPTKRFVLYVTKGDRTSKTNRKIELRVSNSTDAFSELDALLAKKDVAGVLAAVNIISSGIDTDVSITLHDIHVHFDEILNECYL